MILLVALYISLECWGSNTYYVNNCSSVILKFDSKAACHAEKQKILFLYS